MCLFFVLHVSLLHPGWQLTHRRYILLVSLLLLNYSLQMHLQDPQYTPNRDWLYRSLELRLHWQPRHVLQVLSNNLSQWAGMGWLFQLAQAVCLRPALGYMLSRKEVGTYYIVCLHISNGTGCKWSFTVAGFLWLRRMQPWFVEW